MSVKVNYFKIGVFVIIITILLVVSILGFKRPRMKNPMFIETYMNESVAGLNVGSDIFYRGVKIGIVENIDFASSRYTSNTTYGRYVVVDMVIESSKLLGAGSYGDLCKQIKKLADGGLRMQLSSNPLTGVSTLEADYPMDPDDQLPCDWEPLYDFIPSQKSMLNSFSESIQKGFKALEEIDINDIGVKLDKILIGIESIISDANDLGLVGDIDAFFALATEKVSEFDTDKINQDAKVFILKATEAADSIRNTLLTEDGELKIVIGGLLKKFEEVFKTLEDLAASQSPDIEKILDDLGEFAENVKELSEELKKNPGKFIQKPAESEIMK